MNQKPQQRYRFWQELKRRGVPKVMAMYAATAFIIIEASDIILPRLGLPDWTVTLMIILLIVGFPATFALSWIFDITPQGVVKTEPLDHESSTENEDRDRRRKLRISDVVIGVLLIAVAILAYPKIFDQGRSKIPREIRGKISIAVMPFKNVSGDTIYNLWQEGMQNLMITALSNSPELSVRQFETMNNALAGRSDVNYAALTPSISSKLAQKLEANTVISGSLHKSGSKIRITANIMNAETEEIFKSYELDGFTEDDLFTLADSISLKIRDFLEIRNLRKGNFFDSGDIFTQSADAYKAYILGLQCHTRLDYNCAADHYNRAIELDSNFVSAMIKLAYCCGDMKQAELSKSWAYKAYDRVDQLPSNMQILVKAVKASADKKPLKQLEYCRQYLEMDPHSNYMTYMTGWINFNLEQWPEAIDSFEKSLEMLKKLDANPWSWTYILLGGAYHEVGDHKKEDKTFETGRELWPGQSSTFDYWQAICAVSQGDSVGAKGYLSAIKKMTELKGWPEANLYLWYAGIHTRAESYEKAEEYYREALRLRPGNELVTYDVANFLITHDINVEEGMTMLLSLMVMNPDSAPYLYTYGVALYKMGNYKEAENALQKSWDRKPYYDHKHFVLAKKINDELNRG